MDAPTGRSQHVVYVLPDDPASAAVFLEPALERAGIDESAGVALVIVSGDADSTVSLAETVAALRPSASVVAATTLGRATRILRSGVPSVVIGTPSVLLGLVRSTTLKLDAVRGLAIAWADLASPDLEALMADVSRDAARTLVAASNGPVLEEFVERYARRPRRVAVEADAPAAADGTAEVADSAAPHPIRYVTVAPGSRPVALRRVLDETDPPSAVVRVRTDESRRAVEATLRVLGYTGPDAVVRIAGETAVDAALVVLYDAPLTEHELRSAVTGAVVHVIALVQPRELARLRAIAGGAPVTALTLSGPAARARSREDALRDELRTAMAAGIPARELLALEPLLGEFDGVELAAAALRLVDRARATAAAAAVAAAHQPAAPVAAWATPSAGASPATAAPAGGASVVGDGESGGARPPRTISRSRDDRPRDERPRDERPRYDRPRDDRPREGRGERPANGERFAARSGPRPFGDRPARSGPSRGGAPRSGPPRSGPSRGASAGGARSGGRFEQRDDRPRDDRPARGPRAFDGSGSPGKRPFGAGRGRPAGGPPGRGGRTGGAPGRARPGDDRSGGPRGPRSGAPSEWAERGERLTHARRPPPRGRGRATEPGESPT